LALVIFIGAGVTDLYDGYLARKYKNITTLGTFLDPIADKMLIGAAFIAFIPVKEFDVPVWMVVLIIAREFLIMGLRNLGAAKGRIIQADKWGKVKTAVQVSVVIIILIILIVISGISYFSNLTLVSLFHMQGWERGLYFVLTRFPFWLTLIAVIVSILSFVSYAYHARDLLKEEKG